MANRACLACGEECRIVHWSGAVGPFCSQACQAKNEDLRLWGRASAYAGRVLQGKPQPDESDIARAFVIGYAAAAEEYAHRRTVRK